MPIAVGLMTAFQPSTNSPKWIGHQALFGFGVGLGIQQPLLVIQTVLPEADVPVGTALITLTQSLFAAIFMAVAQNVFRNQLSKNIHSFLSGFDVSNLSNGGATTVASTIPQDSGSKFREAYSKSVTQTFYVALALGVLSLVGSLGTEWKSVKKPLQAGSSETITEREC